MSCVNASPLSHPSDRAGHLFRANAALRDEHEWLAHLNRYVALFDLEPLELAEGGAPRLLRLHARALRFA